jgi:hypothetical protein
MSTGPIRIELVKVAGKYIGRTASDRWNLTTLGLGDLNADRNQTAIKKARRAHPAYSGFTFNVVRCSPAASVSIGRASYYGFIDSQLTPEETDALTPPIETGPSFAARMARTFTLAS